MVRAMIVSNQAEKPPLQLSRFWTRAPSLILQLQAFSPVAFVLTIACRTMSYGRGNQQAMAAALFESVETDVSSRTIRMTNFPAGWQTLAEAQLVGKIKALLQTMGGLEQPPSAMRGKHGQLMATATFSARESAEKAVKTLHGVDNRTEAEKRKMNYAVPRDVDKFAVFLLGASPEPREIREDAGPPLLLYVDEIRPLEDEVPSAKEVFLRDLPVEAYSLKSLTRLCLAALCSTRKGTLIKQLAPLGSPSFFNTSWPAMHFGDSLAVPQWYFIAMMNSPVMLVFEQPLSSVQKGELESEFMELCLRIGQLEAKLLRPKQETLELQVKKLCQKIKASSLLLLDESSSISKDLQGLHAWRSAQQVQVVLADQTMLVPVFWNPATCITCKLSSTSPILAVPLVAMPHLSHCSHEECSWSWQRDECGSGRTRRWQTVGAGAVYIPGAADEGCTLRVGCTPPSLAGTTYSQVSNPVIAGPPDDFRWTAFSTPRATRDIRISTYNVLADAFASTKQAKRDMFYYCAADVLSAGPRRQRILRDLLKIDADIVGLQEVDTTQLAVLRPMTTLGWEHTHLKKTGASLDGCALLWRSSRFQCEDQMQWCLSGKLPGLDDKELRALEGHPTQVLLDKMTAVAQAVLLRDLQEDRLLLVANTHLYYHPKGNHIRLLQLYSLLKVLAQAATQAESEGQPVALVVLGDLNARKGNFGPRDKDEPPQAAYRLIRDGIIHADDSDWQHSTWMREEERTTCICCEDKGNVLGIGTCPLCEGMGLNAWHESFSSKGVQALALELKLPWLLRDPNDHIEVTNFTGDFQECLDYTLIDKRCLRATRTFDPPPLERLRESTALPSEYFPSDHIPVVVEVTYLDLCGPGDLKD
eukprot:s1263_g14.t1